MALPNAPGNPATSASEAGAYLAPAQRPGASGGEIAARPVDEWLSSYMLGILLGIGAVVGIGFIVLSCGVFVFQNEFVMFAGLILMNLGAVAWALTAIYLIVKAIRKVRAMRGQSASQPDRRS